MHYTSQYPSPLGELLLAADDAGLTGVWFVGQKYFARSLAPDSVAREIPLFAQVKQWLFPFLSGPEPSGCPLLRGTGAGTGNPHSHGGNHVSEGGVAHPPHHSVWADHDLWRHCPAGGGGAGYPADVPPGGGGRSGTQSNFHPYPMPPGGGDQRQPDGIRRTGKSNC